MNEPVIGVLIVLGGLFSAVAGIGILRLPDVLVRMHASTKAGTLGVGLIVIGAAFHFDGTLVVAKALLIVLFLLLTAPVGAHLIGRAAYRSGTPLWEGTVIDERDRMLVGADERHEDVSPTGATPAAAGGSNASPDTPGGDDRRESGDDDANAGRRELPKD